MAKEDNLIPWKPGQSGNPKGRRKGSVSITKLIKERLAADDGARAKQLADALIEGACNEDSRSQAALAKLVVDRVDGALIARIELVAKEKAANDVLAIAERVLPPEHYERLLVAISEPGGAEAAGEDSEESTEG